MQYSTKTAMRPSLFVGAITNRQSWPLGDTVTVLCNHECKESKSDPLDSIVETPTRMNCPTDCAAGRWTI
jgi:hypothetical protein